MRTLARITALTASMVAVAAIVVAPAQAAAAVPSAVTPAPHPVRTDVCPEAVPSGTLREGSAGAGASVLCRQAVAAAPTAQARKAIRAAFHLLGAPYACEGVGRLEPWRFDCASLVSRAYEAAGVDTAGPGWSASTRDMVPWGGSRLAGWAAYVAPAALRPGDLVLYNAGSASSRHVAMYIGNGYMLHTGYCGDVAHISGFWGFGQGGKRSFLVARRVILPGEPTSYGAPRRVSAPATTSTAVAAYPGRPLRVGSTGAAVTSLQRALIRKGYAIPAVQAGTVGFGNFGAQTREAVVRYQRKHGLLASLAGTVGAKLYRSITGSTSTGSSTPTAKPRTSTSTSSRGTWTVSVAAVAARNPAAVKVVEWALNYTVGAGLKVDGRWTAATQSGFDQFRRQVMKLKGAAATGEPGRGSIVALGKYAGFRVVA